jgi:hypothetical protein
MTKFEASQPRFAFTQPARAFAVYAYLKKRKKVLTNLRQ